MDFFPAALNGQEARLILDTGSDRALLTDTAAKRLGLNFTAPPDGVVMEGVLGLSDPVRITAGAKTIPAQVQLGNIPGVDLIIGWPAVRDNILFFDGAIHAAGAITELPVETANWLKLTVAADDSTLSLNIPLPNETTGAILVDTGDSGGVVLPPAQWKEWLAAHPQAPVKTMRLTGMAGTGDAQAAWADKVQIGPLTLTDVPVRNALPWESNGNDNFAGSLGLAALARMDLIVDAKNGFAYLRPIPPGTPTDVSGATATTRDWVVVDNVRLDRNSFMLSAAEYKIDTKDNAGAIAACDDALQADPKNVDAYTLRAIAKENQDDHEGAIADCDRALALDPQNDDAATLRALAVESKSGNRSALPAVNPTFDSNPKNSQPGLLVIFSTMKRTAVEMNNGDYDAAITNLNSLIHFLPDKGHLTDDDSVFFLMRGAAWAGKGDDDQALANLSQAIAMAPKNAEAYLFRAGSWQNRGDFAHALSDYDQGIKLSRDDSRDPRLYRELLMRRRGHPTKNFAQIIAGWNEGWPKTLGQFMVGKLDEAGLLAASTRDYPDGGTGQKCEAYYFIGVLRLLNGDMAAARDFLQKCVAENPKMTQEAAQFARADLARLNPPAALGATGTRN